MLYYLKEQKKVTTANILSILRGALNYPLEESCYREHIRVHDISFLSSERVFADEEIAGLEIKYSKLTMVPDSTLMIGDIIASGETLIHCLRYVTDFYRKNGARLRNIIVFTIGGTKGIDILEESDAKTFVNSGRILRDLLPFIMKEFSAPIRIREFPVSIFRMLISSGRAVYRCTGVSERRHRPTSSPLFEKMYHLRRRRKTLRDPRACRRGPGVLGRHC